MESKIEPIEKFIKELKSETSLSENEENELIEILEEEAKKFNSDELKEFLTNINAKMHASGSNIFIDNGINLKGIKIIAKEASEVIKQKEIQKNNKETKNNESQQDFISGNLSNEENLNANKENNYGKLISNYIERKFSGVSESTKRYLENALKDAAGFHESIEIEGKDDAEQKVNYEKQKEKYAQEKGMHKEEVDLNLVELFGAITTQNEGIHIESPKDLLAYLEGQPKWKLQFEKLYVCLKEGLSKNENLTFEELGKMIDPKKFEKSQEPQNALPKNNKKIYNLRQKEPETPNTEVKPSKMPWEDFFEKFILNTYRDHCIKKIKEEMNNNYKIIKKGTEQDMLDFHLSDAMMSYEENKYKFNKQNELRTNKKNKSIDNSLKKHVLKGVFEENLSVGRIWQNLRDVKFFDDESLISVYDLIDIVDEELSKHGITELQKQEFIKNEKEIAKLAIQQEACKKLEKNLEKTKGWAEEEKLTNRDNKNGLEVSIAYNTEQFANIREMVKKAGIKTVDVSQRKKIKVENFKKFTPKIRDNEVEKFVLSNQENVDISAPSKKQDKNSFFGFFRKKRITREEVEDQRSELVIATEKFREKRKMLRDSVTNRLAKKEDTIIDNGEEIENTSDDGGR